MVLTDRTFCCPFFWAAFFMENDWDERLLQQNCAASCTIASPHRRYAMGKGAETFKSTWKPVLTYLYFCCPTSFRCPIFLTFALSKVLEMITNWITVANQQLLPLEFITWSPVSTSPTVHSLTKTKYRHIFWTWWGTFPLHDGQTASCCFTIVACPHQNVCFLHDQTFVWCCSAGQRC